MLNSAQLQRRFDCQMRQELMSRYGTPSSDFGRLALGASSGSSSADMPAITRAMRRASAGVPGSQQSAASGAGAAGASRNAGRSAGGRRGSERQARTASDDSEDSGDESSGDDTDEDDEDVQARQQNALAAFEIAAALDQGLQAPRELVAANARDNPQRRLADVLASRFRDQGDLHVLRSILSQADALNRVADNFRRRYQSILSNIALNVDNSSRGVTVVEGLRSLRNLASAIGQHIAFYSRLNALPDRGRGLVDLLLEMLASICARDEDAYAGARMPRAQYAGGGNTGNLFREFVREHMGTLEVLLRLPAPLLRQQQEPFIEIITKVRAHGPTNGDRAQFQQLLTVMHQIFQRMRNGGE